MMNSSPDQDKPEGAENSALATAQRTVSVLGDRIDSRELFSGAREIIIGHGSDIYRLRLTAQNKLILTK